MLGEYLVGIKVVKYVTGPLSTNMYLIYDEELLEALILDPGGVDVGECVSTINELGLRVKYIIATHGHVDHVLGVSSLRQLTNAQFLIHPDDEVVIDESSSWMRPWGLNLVDRPRSDGYLLDGDLVKLGKAVVKVIHTPGHTPGSLTLYIPSYNIAFTGDTLFAGSVGRTDLPRGSLDLLKGSLRRLLRELGSETVIYPGHGPATKMGLELRRNVYLRYVVNELSNG